VSDANFEGLWKRLRVFAPEAPIPLVQEFVNTAYSRALAYHLWNDLRGQSAAQVPALYNTGNVTVVQGSATVTGVNGAAFTTAMINRQFFTGAGTVADPSSTGTLAPYYTIIARPDATTLTLDRPYEKPTDATGDLTYSILQVYIEMPSDFLRFESIVDIDNNWKLHTNFRQEQINIWDAKRSVSGTTWIVASAPPRFPSGGAAEIQRYELWPKTSPGPKTFPFWYTKKPALLSAATDRPISPIRGDVIRKGALAELACWPGTGTSPNPYFNLDLHVRLDKEFTDGLDHLVREDNERSQRAVWYEDWEGVPYAPIDARYLQTHDVF